jgi:hypothetical protein
VLGVLEIGSQELYGILLISACQVASITGMSPWHLVSLFLNWFISLSMISSRLIYGAADVRIFFHFEAKQHIPYFVCPFLH